MLVHFCALQFRTVHFITLQYSTLQVSKLEFSTIQSNTPHTTFLYTLFQYTLFQYTLFQYNPVQWITVQDSAVQYTTVKYTIFPYSTVMHSHFSTLQLSTLQLSTVQLSTLTVQYSTVQIHCSSAHCISGHCIYVHYSSLLEGPASQPQSTLWGDCLCPETELKMQFSGVVGFKNSTVTVYCLSSWFVHQQRKTYSNLCVLWWPSHMSWFPGPKYVLPSFWLWVTNHEVKSKLSKKWFLWSLLFYTTFSWCWKFDEET